MMKKMVNLIQRVAITHIDTRAGGFVIVQDYLVFSCCFSLNPPGNPEMCARQSDSKQQQSLVWLPLAHHPTTQSHLSVGPMFFICFSFQKGNVVLPFVQLDHWLQCLLSPLKVPVKQNPLITIAPQLWQCWTWKNSSSPDLWNVFKSP